MSNQATEPIAHQGVVVAPADETAGRKTLVSVISVLGATASMACCVIPFALFFLGISGAWIANLTALAPYKPVFVVATLAFLGVGYFMVYRRPKVACADGTYCTRPSSNRVAKVGLWTATILVVLAMTVSYWAPLLVAA